MKNPSHNPHPIPADLKALISAARRRRTKLFTYGFVFAFVACTAFLAFNPSSNAPSPWFHNLFSSSSSSSSFKSSIAPYRAQVSSFWNSLFFNSSSLANNPAGGGNGSSKGAILGNGSVGSGAVKPNRTRATDSGENGVLASSQVKHGSEPEKKKNGASEVKNQTATSVGSKRSGVVTEKAPVLESKNQTNEIGLQVKNNGVLASSPVNHGSGPEAEKNGASEVKNQTATSVGSKRSGVVTGKAPVLESKNQTNETGVQVAGASKKNQTATNEVPLKSNGASASAQKEAKANHTTKSASSLKSNGASASAQKETKASNSTTNLASPMGKGSGSGLEVAKAISSGNGKKREKFIEDMIGCDLFKGHWVKDDSYPLYPEGSCPHIDEPFDCYLNGRQDRSYQKLRWQPDGCNIPRLNATDMLERLRGKRLVFVGDSLNRNMWESLVCVLRNSVRDKKTVFEASGRHEFRTEGSYSFLFKDYGTTIEFFRSPFLVQEWEMPIGNGTKETLRLDIIERSSTKYKDAHVIIFNTGHWWTHDKTAKGKDYYQEGNKVYGELNVVEAFHKALNTWAKWVDHNVDSKKSLVFFRGYSASHFRGGQWNSGGACDKETEPIKNEAYLSSYPPKMTVLEQVIKEMKTPVAYLNITRMTDYRKDAHPSVYRKQNLTEEEMRDPLRFQDCSHWCLPGVPDSWNELVYAQLIIKQYQMAQ